MALRNCNSVLIMGTAVIAAGHAHVEIEDAATD